MLFDGRCHHETTSSIRRLEEDLKRISDRITTLTDGLSPHAMGLGQSNEEQLEIIIRRVVAQEVVMPIYYAQRLIANVTIVLRKIVYLSVI